MTQEETNRLLEIFQMDIKNLMQELAEAKKEIAELERHKNTRIGPGIYLMVWGYKPGKQEEIQGNWA